MPLSAFSRILANRGVNVRYVDCNDLDAVAAAAIDKAKLIYLETPTNPLLQIIDISAIADIAHRSGALVCVDNSTMSPWPAWHSTGQLPDCPL